MSPASTFFRWRPHPWHGLEAGSDAPQIVQAYIEMTPQDLVKYEIDKESGYLRVDRPQPTSSTLPSYYGFIPKTFCGPRVAALMKDAAEGDGDPLDICVFSERPILKSEILLNAHVIGGLPMLDEGEADDKIIAILEKDAIWGGIQDISEFPAKLVDRIRHYFLTYKMVSGKKVDVSIGDAYGKEAAENVIKASMADYDEIFGKDYQVPLK
ncbi:MAG: inorganic pyrophosphatase [Nitrospiria bacterium]